MKVFQSIERYLKEKLGCENVVFYRMKHPQVVTDKGVFEIKTVQGLTLPVTHRQLNIIKETGASVIVLGSKKNEYPVLGVVKQDEIKDKNIVFGTICVNIVRRSDNSDTFTATVDENNNLIIPSDVTSRFEPGDEVLLRIIKVRRKQRVIDI